MDTTETQLEVAMTARDAANAEREAAGDAYHAAAESGASDEELDRLAADAAGKARTYREWCRKVSRLERGIIRAV